MDGVGILPARSDAEIAATFEVMHRLRPHLWRDGYVATMRALQTVDEKSTRSSARREQVHLTHPGTARPHPPMS